MDIQKIEHSIEIFQHFEKYIKLSTPLKSELANRILPKTFKKGEMVHNAHSLPPMPLNVTASGCIYYLNL